MYQPSTKGWMGDGETIARQREPNEVRKAAWFVLLAGAVLVAGLFGLNMADAGPITGHMGTHILLMNFVAPLVAVGVGAGSALRIPLLAQLETVLLAGMVQIALLWAWHAPSVLPAAMASHLGHLAMQASLFVAALWFWLAVFADHGAARWRPLFALLLTGKLFCLLGVLLIFAPRTIYSLAPLAAGGLSPAERLADQQLAGLLMVVVCPLTYLTASVVIAARWLRDLSRRTPDLDYRIIGTTPDLSQGPGRP